MTIRVDEPIPGVRRVLLDRPAVRNAIDLATVTALTQALTEVSALRALVLGSSTDGMFCSGADLAVPDAERAQVSDALYALYGAMVALPVPIIAAVDGAAVGGGAQLVLAADVRIGSPRARIKFAGPAHGLAVGLWALPVAVGRGRAMELALSQRFLDAAEAESIGLVDRLADDPLAAAIALAAQVTALDADAVTRAKRLVVAGERLVERLRAERGGNAGFDGRRP